MKKIIYDDMKMKMKKTTEYEDEEDDGEWVGL